MSQFRYFYNDCPDLTVPTSILQVLSIICPKHISVSFEKNVNQGKPEDQFSVSGLLARSLECHLGFFVLLHRLFLSLIFLPHFQHMHTIWQEFSPAYLCLLEYLAPFKAQLQHKPNKLPFLILLAVNVTPT